MKRNGIQHSTPKQQITKLKSQNLEITNEKFAEAQLLKYGYSNLIKSYREPYTYIKDGRKIYRTGVTFEQIHSLYMLDKNLRNSVMAAMLDLEEHIKEVAADVVSNSFGVHQDNYLNFRNYRDRNTSKVRFSLKNILKTMRDTLNTDKNPIAHYNRVHNTVPPWILFKSIYFSTMINFIKLFKPKEQLQMVKRLYNTHEFELSNNSLRMLMIDTLFIALEYRNIAAHGGRTYNYTCNSALRSNQIFSSSDTNGTFFGFSDFLVLLKMLKYQEPYIRLAQTLSDEVNRHCNHFPQDVTYLGQVLNIDITESIMVYISPRSQKYHTLPHCSGIRNAERIEYEDAVSLGYVPCQKCAKELSSNIS